MKREPEFTFQVITGRHKIYRGLDQIATADDIESARLIVGALNERKQLQETQVNLIVALKEAMKVVSDRAAGGRMLTTAEEASGIWDKCAKAIYDAEKGPSE